MQFAGCLTEILTLHSQLDLPGLTLTHGVVCLTDIHPGLLPPDVIDLQGLLPADDLPAALSVPHDGRGGIGGCHTGEGHLVTL